MVHADILVLAAKLALIPSAPSVKPPWQLIPPQHSTPQQTSRPEQASGRQPVWAWTDSPPALPLEALVRLAHLVHQPPAVAVKVGGALAANLQVRLQAQPERAGWGGTVG